MTETLVRVVAPDFVAGLIVKDDKCTFAAPKLRRWCLGMSSADLRLLFERRGWKASIVKTETTGP